MTTPTKSSSSSLFASDDEGPIALSTSTTAAINGTTTVFDDDAAVTMMIMMTTSEEANDYYSDTNTTSEETAFARLISNQSVNKRNSDANMEWLRNNNNNNDFQMTCWSSTTSQQQRQRLSSPATLLRRRRQRVDTYPQRMDNIITTHTSSTNNNNNNNECWNWNHHHHQQQQQQRSSSLQRMCILFGGTFLLLLYGFIWSSFTSNVWYRTILSIENRPLLRWTIQSNNLLSFLQQIASPLSNSATNHHHSTATTVISVLCSCILVVTTVIVPCVTMVLLPIRMINMIKQPLETIQPAAIHNNVYRLFSILSMYDIMVRLSFLFIYMILWTMMANHFVSIHLSTTSTVVSLHTSIDNGLVSYMIGVSLATICVVMIRWYHAVTPPAMYDRIATNHDSLPANQQSHWSSSREAEGTQLPAQMVADNMSNAPLMQILEEQSEVTIVGATENSLSSNERQSNRATSLDAGTTTVPLWKLVFVFQCGVLSILFLIPAFYLPVLQFDYTGFISTLMSTPARHIVTLYTIPSILYADAIATETPIWMIGLFLCFMILTTILCPLYAITMAILAWMIPPSISIHQPHPGVPSLYKITFTRDQCRYNLYMIHPAIGSIAVTISLLLIVLLLQDWNIIFGTTDITNNICHYLGSGNNDWCTSITLHRISLHVGAWCYVAHSILLEVFITFTLYWS